MKDPITGNLVELDKAWTEGAAYKILGETPGMQSIDYAEWQRTGEINYHTAEYGTGAREKFLEIKGICELTGNCSTTFDLGRGVTDAIKFDTDTLHIRFFGKDLTVSLQYHWDIYNIRTDFWSHLWVDVIKEPLYEWGVLSK